MRRKRHVIAFALAFVLASGLLSACDGGGGTTTSGITVATATTNSGGQSPAENSSTTASVGELDLSKIDPCSLLTSEEVEAALGSVEYNPGQKKLVTYNGAIRCAYSDKVIWESTILTVYPKEATDTLPGLFGWQDPQKVPGLGDDAYAGSHNDLGDVVYVVLKNKAVVSLIVPVGKVEQAKQLAPKILERLNR